MVIGTFCFFCPWKMSFIILSSPFNYDPIHSFPKHLVEYLVCAMYCASHRGIQIQIIMMKNKNEKKMTTTSMDT